MELKFSLDNQIHESQSLQEIYFLKKPFIYVNLILDRDGPTECDTDTYCFQ